MATWFRGGGFSMWFLVVLGLLALLAAGSFAHRPDPGVLARVGALARAVGWTMLTGVASDLAEVARAIPNTPAWAHDPDLVLVVLTGISESLAPAVLGSAILSAIALLTAVGHGRMRAHGAAP